MCRCAPGHLYLAIKLFSNHYSMKQFYKIHLLVNKEYVEFILIFSDSLRISNKLSSTLVLCWDLPLCCDIGIWKLKEKSCLKPRACTNPAQLRSSVQMPFTRFQLGCCCCWSVVRAVSHSSVALL